MVKSQAIRKMAKPKDRKTDLIRDFLSFIQLFNHTSNKAAACTVFAIHLGILPLNTHALINHSFTHSLIQKSLIT